MKKGSTLFLRGVILILGLLALALLVLVLPRAIVAETWGDFDYGFIFLGMYISAVPFFIALYQSLRLLGLIDKNNAFSQASSDSLKVIRNCAITISGMYALGMPYIFYVADRDDAPGVAAIGFVIIGASAVIAVFAAVLQRLLQSAIDIKSENELTV